MRRRSSMSAARDSRRVMRSSSGDRSRMTERSVSRTCMAAASYRARRARTRLREGVHMPTDPAYRRLPTEGVDDPLLGAALITWVEPMPNHVVGYNRWYEDDHMITGAMVMPWMFSCRRWVSPRWLQHLRAPVGSRVAEPLEAGKYIGLYWINAG